MLPIAGQVPTSPGTCREVPCCVGIPTHNQAGRGRLCRLTRRKEKKRAGGGYLKVKGGSERASLGGMRVPRVNQQKCTDVSSMSKNPWLRARSPLTQVCSILDARDPLAKESKAAVGF